MKLKINYKLFRGDCLDVLRSGSIKNVHLTFVDPPFNQGKDYAYFNDEQVPDRYWSWMTEVFRELYHVSANGSAIYFMQREKNTEQILKTLRETDWLFQNLIVWKKKTSAIPSDIRFSKQYQIIAFATKGERPRVFNKLRIDLPHPPEYRYRRANGIYLPDIWDDIRELTSGFYAGNEAIRDRRGCRVHTQQSPIALLLRVILSSSRPQDTVLDPFTGTGTSLVVANQLNRNSIGVEIDPTYVRLAEDRLRKLNKADDISAYHDSYKYTPNLAKIWS